MQNIIPWKVELKIIKQCDPFEIVLYRDVYVVHVLDARTCPGYVKKFKIFDIIIHAKRESSLNNKNLIDFNKRHILLHERCEMNITAA